MADVIGPTSTMPGSVHKLPDKTVCDTHPDKLAVIRIQGETDSFGAELNDMCQECLDEYKKYLQEEDTSGQCDWCKTDVQKRVTTRDYEEGLAGRLYYVCEPCLNKYSDKIREEFDEDSRYDDDFED